MRIEIYKNNVLKYTNITNIYQLLHTNIYKNKPRMP